MEASEIVPLYVEDIGLGNLGAPVTLVIFLDLECPYCAQAWATVERLRRRFAADQLRVVLKQLPLPFHRHASMAARHLLEVQRQQGSQAAVLFLQCAFARQSELSDRVLTDCRVACANQSAQPGPYLSSLTTEMQIERDLLLARRLGIDATPAFRINGIALEGAIPDTEFERVIESELSEARRAVASGTLAGSVYARRVAYNHAPPAPSQAKLAEPDPTRWAIPTGDSPSMGPITAPVTLVAFMDYECPFCQRGYAVLQQLREKYPTQLRLVWKHRPLEFHEHASAASQLALEVRKQKGDGAFWAISEQLFARQSDLSSKALAELATTAQLDDRIWQRHVQNGDLDAALAVDCDWADDFSVESTPQFFINGLRIQGTRSLDDFSSWIERELTLAAKLRADGIPEAALSARIMADAQPAPVPMRIDAQILLPDGPSTGPAAAPVTIHAFSDFECPFCQRAHQTVRSLLVKYPKVARLVWHDLPLGIHPRARSAATFARAIRAQRGDAIFFQLADTLFEQQADLSEGALEKYASSLGVSGDSLEESQRERSHGGAVDRDRALADALHVSSTPTFIVGRYLLEGSQPIRRFERLVRRALAEQRAPKPSTGKR